LSGCTTTQLKAEFPEPPSNCMIPAPSLKLLEDGKLSNAEGIIVDNYSAYYTAVDRLDCLQDWANSQKKIK